MNFDVIVMCTVIVAFDSNYVSRSYLKNCMIDDSKRRRETKGKTQNKKILHITELPAVRELTNSWSFIGLCSIAYITTCIMKMYFFN